MYEIIFSRQASKFISTLPEGYKNNIKSVFEKLKENPYSYPYKKIKGETNLYRVRVGRYRILYEIDKNSKLIVVIKIDKRERVYE